MRAACLTPLLKTVKTAFGKRIFAPLKVFCYKSVIQSIEQFVQQPEILTLFNQWKNRSIPTGVMADVYDGAVWKSFLTVDGKQFV